MYFYIEPWTPPRYFYPFTSNLFSSCCFCPRGVLFILGRFFCGLFSFGLKRWEAAHLYCRLSLASSHFSLLTFLAPAFRISSCYWWSPWSVAAVPISWEYATRVLFVLHTNFHSTQSCSKGSVQKANSDSGCEVRKKLINIHPVSFQLNFLCI